MKNNIKPLSDNVLIKPLEADQKTASGILLPDSAKEKPQVGLVMGVGPGLVSPEGKILPMNVKVGQKVMYKKWGGDEIKVNGEEWMIVKQGDILAIVEDGKLNAMEEARKQFEIIETAKRINKGNK